MRLAPWALCAVSWGCGRTAEGTSVHAGKVETTFEVATKDAREINEAPKLATKAVLAARPDTFEVGFWEPWERPGIQKFRGRYSSFLFDAQGHLLERLPWAAVEPVLARYDSTRQRTDEANDRTSTLVYRVSETGELTIAEVEGEHDLGSHARIEVSLGYVIWEGSRREIETDDAPPASQTVFAVFDQELKQVAKFVTPVGERACSGRLVTGSLGREFLLRCESRTWRYSLLDGKLLEERLTSDERVLFERASGRAYIQSESGVLRSYSSQGKLMAEWPTSLVGERGPGTPDNFVFLTSSAVYRLRKGKSPQHILSLPRPVQWFLAPEPEEERALVSCPAVWIQAGRGGFPGTLGAVDLCGEAKPITIDIDVSREMEKFDWSFGPLRYYWSWITPTSFAVPTASDQFSVVSLRGGHFQIHHVARKGEQLVGLSRGDNGQLLIRWGESGYYRYDLQSETLMPFFSEVQSRPMTQVAYLDNGRYLALGNSGRDWSGRTGNSGGVEPYWAGVIDLKSGTLMFKDADIAPESLDGSVMDRSGDFCPSDDDAGLEVLAHGSLTMLWRPWEKQSLVPAKPEKGWSAAIDAATLRSATGVTAKRTFKVDAQSDGTVLLKEAGSLEQAAKIEFSRLPIASVAASANGDCVAVSSQGSEIGIYRELLKSGPQRIKPPALLPERTQLALDAGCDILAMAYGDGVYLIDLHTNEWLNLHILTDGKSHELLTRHSRGWIDAGPLGRKALIAPGSHLKPVDLTGIVFPHLLQSFVVRARKAINGDGDGNHSPSSPP